MTELDPKNQAAPEIQRELKTGHDNNRTSDGDYIVGKNRPPRHSRYKPGHSGNPKGRPKGRRNVKMEIQETISKKIKIRQGNMEQYVTLPVANVLAHAIKGAQGDVRSAQLFLNSLLKWGLLGDDDDGKADFALRGGAIVPSNNVRQSDLLFEGLRTDLLSHDEQIELSRIAALIDLGGDFTALSDADFLRVKHLVNKGRGKDVSPC